MPAFILALLYWLYEAIFKKKISPNLQFRCGCKNSVIQEFCANPKHGKRPCGCVVIGRERQWCYRHFKMFLLIAILLVFLAASMLPPLL